MLRRCAPNHNDDEIQEVPAIADVGAGMEHQPIGHDLEHRLHRENHQKYVLHLLLRMEPEIRELLGLGGGVDGGGGRGQGG